METITIIGFAIDGGVGMPDLARVEVDGEPAWKFPDAPNPKWRYATLIKVNGKNDVLLVSRDARTWCLAIAVVVKGELCSKEDLGANEVAR